MKRAGKERGFTLLELIVALALIGALLAIGLPRLSATLPPLVFDQAVRHLAAEIELARVRAVARNSRTRVVVLVTQASYDVESEVEGRFQPDGERRVLPRGVAFDPLASSRVVGDRVSIVFQPRGHTADNSTIALAAGENRRRVIVNNAGRVRTE